MNLEREELTLLFLDLKLSPLLITFFPEVEKFLKQLENVFSFESFTSST